MKDHYDGHDEGGNVGKGGGGLEDDGVRELDIAGITVRLYPDAQVDVADAAHEGAQWYGRIAADRIKVSKAHTASGYRC